jgi:hypothetical protein
MIDHKKADDESADEYAKRMVREYDEWLDEMAHENGVQAAYDIAKANRNSVGNWGERWLYKHGLNDANIAPLAKRQSALAKFETACAEFNKGTGKTGVNAFLETEHGRELYRDVCKAETAAQFASDPAGHTPAEPSAVSQADAMANLEKGLTAFCKAKGIAKPWTEGLEAYTQTDEGRALKAAVDEATH